MNFLYPGFLFALFTVAIPVIIHLFNFRRFKKVYFSNVAFLNEVKAQHSSREKLKNLLILCCRILALVFLVFAFSRPFIPANTSIDLQKGNIISVYIDNSYSMEAVNKEGSLLDEAKRKAKQIVNAYEVNDRFQLLTNDFEGRHQRLLQADEFLAAIEEVKISAASRRLQQVMNRQQAIFTGNSNRFSYLISDFQLGLVGKETILPDTNTHHVLVQLRANALPNIAVDSAWFLTPIHQPNATEKLVIRLRNYGEEDAQNIPVKLTINATQKAMSTLSVGAGKTKTDTLSFSGLTKGWQKGIVSIKDFPLTFDDQLNFAFKVNEEQKVASINGAKAGKNIKALFTADPYFKLREMPEAQIDYAALFGYSLIILNGLENPSSGLAQQLKLYVANGGTVVVFPDLDAKQTVYTAFLTALGLPGIVQLENTPVQVSAIELKHPLFNDVFETLAQQLDLPMVKRYFIFKENNTTNKENLLQLPPQQLFFARYPKQAGQLFLSASSLTAEDSNFATHPVFVPLLYKIAFASNRLQPLYYTAMKDQVIESEQIAVGVNQSLKLVADNFEIIPALKQSNGKSLLYIEDQVKQAGFYDLKKGDTTLSVIAFNENSLESDMHYSTPAALKKIFNQKQATFLDSNSDLLASAVTAKNNGTELWKLCLILTLFFLALEIIIVRFYTIQKSTKP